MAEHLFKNWPVYVLFTAMICFYCYVIIKGNQAQKDKKNQDKPGE